MSVFTMYGVNGVGKDRVASITHSNHPELVLTSESRILMYLSGITPEFGTDYRTSRDQYKKLEDTPQEEILALKETQFHEFIGNIAADERPTLVLSHLIFRLHLDKHIEYLTDQPIPAWYLDTGKAFVNLVAPASEILKRRLGEQAQRDRTIKGIEEIEIHQALCDERWNSIVEYIGDSVTCKVVNNIDPHVASAEVWEAINE